MTYSEIKLEAGTQLGLFTVIKQIGSGGMSSVFLVKDNLQREWALKVLNLGLSTDSGAKQRFEYEATILSKLEHPNIINIHSYFEEGPYHCLVMKYFDCGSLKDLIGRIGPVVEKRSLAILSQIASALAYAHGLGVIHRDIKPSNILVDVNDKVTIVDFGVSRILGDVGLTKTGSNLGTPSYMSPEQVVNSKDIAPSTDVYSLGVSFYEMLCGKTLYDLDTLSDFKIFEKIVYQPISDPRDIYPDISDKTISLLNRMTNKDAKQRISAQEIVNYIDDAELQTHQVTKDDPVICDIKQHPAEYTPQACSQKPKGSSLKYVAILLATIFVISMVFFLNKRGDNPEYSQSNAVANSEDPFPMSYVEGGSFKMGDTFGLKTEGGLPVSMVTVSSFFMSNTEITQEAWVAVMGHNRSDHNNPLVPVHNVNWFDVLRFCDKLSLQQGLKPCYNTNSWTSSQVDHHLVQCDFSANGYRLPTEAEWEFAARGGNRSRHTKYSGSNNAEEVAWTSMNASNTPMQVAQLKPNELGLHDLSGNVWEWVFDLYGPYTEASKTNPWGQRSGDMRCLRGGSYVYHGGLCLVSFRSYRNPGYKNANLGFRVVRNRANEYSGGSYAELPTGSEATIFPLVQRWNDAHNDDLSDLESLYAPQINLYGQNMTNQEATRLTTDYAKRYISYTQEISDLTLSKVSDGLFRVTFSKRVVSDGDVNIYPSYLEFIQDQGFWKISRVSDLITDRNLGISRI